MNVTSTDIQAINDILKTGDLASNPDHYLAILADDNDHIIYGMDEPQRTYLAISTLVEEVKSRASPKIRLAAVSKRASEDKQGSDKVSNYFIDFNKTGAVIQQAGSFFLQRTAPGAAADADQESARSGFHTRFDASEFGLQRASDSQLTKGVKKDLKTADPGTKGLDYYSGNLKNFAVRRACKFLIYDSIQNGKTIAYILDDMDLDKVVGKQYLHLAGDAKRPGKDKVPVCTSEIREIFRNWDFLKAHVVFFIAFKKVAPPWEHPTATTDQLKKWAAYAAARAGRLKQDYDGKNVKAYDNVKDIVERALRKDLAAKPSIDAYHAAHPSIFNAKHAVVPVGIGE